MTQGEKEKRRERLVAETQRKPRRERKSRKSRKKRQSEDCEHD
jgi:hypothetical protein